MTAPAFSVRVTPHGQRLAKVLNKQHSDFIAYFETAIDVLSRDPYNRSGSHNIKKLRNTAPGQGAWRLRLGRWRFRYDIWEQMVELSYFGLRREETYR